MRRLLLALLCGALWSAACPALASDTAAGAEKLIVEIWVNGGNTGVVARLAKRNGKWWASRADLKEAGINLNEASPLVALANLDGVTSAIDEADLRLVIQAKPERLAPQRIELGRPPASAEPRSDTGLVSSYAITGTAGDLSRPAQSAGVDALLGETLFTPLGTIGTTGFAETSNSSSALVRLDTTGEWDEPQVPRRWIAGDTISGGLAWSRPVRFGGFQVATDFTLQPGLTTFPLPAFFGEAAVPSSVDVFVNSARVFETDVSPGPFELHDLPVVTGDGEATVVVRNILGQETTQSFSFYASEALLRTGLSSYDLDFGFLRRAYGEQSFDYGAPIATGTWRYGVSQFLTLETHGEAAANLQLAGGGGSLALGPYGVAGGDAAISRSASGTGELFAVSVAGASRPFGLFGSLTATAGHYADLANLGGTAEPRLSTQLGANAGFDSYGSAALSWVGLKTSGDSAVQLLTASYTLSFCQGWSFSATGLHDLGNGSWAAELNLTLPIGANLYASATAESGQGANGIGAELSRPTSPDGGFGYSLSASAGQSTGATGDATWMGDHGTLEGAISSVNGQSAGRLSASGAFTLMNGSIFATRNPDGPVALVETGEPNVPVYMENRLVAVSDSDGEALLTNLTADAPNRISIKPTDYSFSTVMNTTEASVVPRRQSGVVADLAPARSRPVLLILRLETGDYPVTGADVQISGASAPLLVGHDGQVFVSDLETHVSGTVVWPGGSCHFAADPPRTTSPNAIPRLGPVLCFREAPHAM